MQTRTPSEWSGAFALRGGIVGLLAVGALLRFWALGHGIPYAVAADEPQIMERVVRMMKTGDLNPHFFDYPGFYLYLQLAVACLRFLSGALAGAWASLEAVSAADFYLWGRAVSAAIGTATLWVLYRIGLRWGIPHAIFAAGLMAVVPQHVRESHYVLTDIPLTFFTTLALLLALRASEQPTLRRFASAGVAAGLAAASKYPGLVALAFPIVAAASVGERPAARARAALAATGACVAAFLLAAPYTVLDLPGFLNGFAYLASHYPPSAATERPSWYLYLIYLRLGLGWPGTVLLFAGLALALERSLRGADRGRWWLLLGFAGPYFWLLAGRSLVFGRYLLPLYPIASILIAAVVVAIVRSVSRVKPGVWLRRSVAGALLAVSLVPPAVTAMSFDRRIARRSTQSLAYEWFLQQVPAGSAIAIEGQALWLPTGRYRVVHVRKLIDRPLGQYLNEGFDYLVASSEVHGAIFARPDRFSQQYVSYGNLFRQLRAVAAFPETKDYPGPTLTVYKISEPASRESR